MGILLFVIVKWASLLVDINCPEVALNLTLTYISFVPTFDFISNRMLSELN